MSFSQQQDCLPGKDSALEGHEVIAVEEWRELICWVVS